MKLEPKFALRLQFLARVVRKECLYLGMTDSRLFEESSSFTVEQVAQLEEDMDLAERVEAFVSRFGRLQDTLADKLLPQLLVALGEKTASAIDNFDKAERLGFFHSVDDWISMRNLRNQMVHENVEDPVLLANALQTGHLFVPYLLSAANKMLAQIEQRGWL